MADWPYGTPEWRQVRPQVLARDEHRCQIRGPRCATTATEVDHTIPLDEGGAPFDLTNLRAACKPCNRGRGQARLAAAAKLNRQVAPAPSREW